MTLAITKSVSTSKGWLSSWFLPHVPHGLLSNGLLTLHCSPREPLLPRCGMGRGWVSLQVVTSQGIVGIKSHP